MNNFTSNLLIGPVFDTDSRKIGYLEYSDFQYYSENEPNIWIFVVDDIFHSEFQCYGHPFSSKNVRFKRLALLDAMFGEN